MLDIKTKECERKEFDSKTNTLTHYFENGNIKAEGPFIQGRPEGEWKYFRETGELWKIGQFQSGLKHGPWISYTKSGDEEFKLKYKNGKIAVR